MAKNKLAPMDEQSKERFDELITMDLNDLTSDDFLFMMARRPYMPPSERKMYYEFGIERAKGNVKEIWKQEYEELWPTKENKKEDK